MCVCVLRCEGGVRFEQHPGLRRSGDREEGARGSDLVHRGRAGEITSHTVTLYKQFYTRMTFRLPENTAGVKCLTTFFFK